MTSWGDYCLTRRDLVDDDVCFAGRAMKNCWILLLTWKEKENTWWEKKQNNLPEEISMVTFSGDRKRTQSADLSTGDDFEVRPQRQEPFDWSSCARTRSFCSDGVGLPGLEITSPARHWYNLSHISMLEISFLWTSCSSFKFPGSTKQVPCNEGRCRKAGR